MNIQQEFPSRLPKKGGPIPSSSPCDSPPPYSLIHYQIQGNIDTRTTDPPGTINTKEQYNQELLQCIRSNEDIFKEALRIIQDPLNDDYAEERCWFFKPYKHDENKPPEALEKFLKYLDDKSKRLNSGVFSKTVRQFRQSESGFRHLAIVVDSIFSLIPEPMGTPAGVLFGIIKFSFKLMFNHRDLIEKVCLDFNMILEKIETVNWTLASYRSDPRIRFAAVKLYISILTYWCRAWHLLKQNRNMLVRFLHFPDKYKVEFENLKTSIQNEGEHLRGMMLTISLEKAKEAETSLEKISDNQDFERLQRLLTPDSTAVSRDRTVSVLSKKLGTRYPGTCCWVEDSPMVLEWLDTRSGKDFLWIHALAGAGKSVTAAYVVQSLISHRRWADQEGVCLYFFCEHSNLVQSSHQEVVKALLLQLLEGHVYHNGRVKADAKAVFEKLHAFGSPDFVKLDERTAEKLHSLLTETSGWGTIWVVLDGIDEYEDTEMQKVLQLLAGVCVRKQSNMKVMIFSRPERFISDWLRSNIPEARYISTEIPAEKVRHDLRLYSKSKIVEILERIEPKYSPATNDTVADKLIDKLLSAEAGDRAPLFLWVSEMIKAMELATNIDGINSLFETGNTPNRLYSLYARSLMRIEMTNSINNHELQRIFQLLCWAVYSRQQPLSMRTLKAISVGGKKAAADIKFWINSTCSSLFVWRLNDEDHIEEDTLHFHHLSVKEFLRQPPDEIKKMCKGIEIFQKGETYKDIPYSHHLVLTAEKAHKQIFDDCIHYLLTATDNKGKAVFQGPLVTTRGDAVRIDDISKRFPFFPYAAKFWPYHLSRTGDCEEMSSRDLLDKFLRSPNLYSWMEGMISAEGGTQWLGVQVAVIRSWLRNISRLQECPRFRHWAADVTGKGFSDYEPTLRYNPNDVHFLDRRTLFNKFVDRKYWVQTGTDVIVDLDFGDQNKERPPGSGYNWQPLQSSPDGTDADDQKATREPCHHPTTLVLPNKPLDLGENDEDFGFINLDQNKPGHQGLLMIDRHVNDPRLAWNCVAPGPSHHELNRGIIPKGVSLESKIETCVKVDPHKLWCTLSAALDYTGSTLAAVFGETVPASGKEKEPARVRLKTILWRFVPEDPTEFTSWKHNINAARLRYIEAVNNALILISQSHQEGRNLSRSVKQRALQEVEDRNRDVRTTMAQRPPLPSHVPCQRGDFWAMREELYIGTDDYDQIDTIMSCRYLVAFRGGSQLITPRGIWDLDARQYSVRYPPQAFEAQFVVVPGGLEILRFYDSSMTVLEIIDAADFAIRGYVLIELLGDFTRFGRIIDCSDSGRLVALTMINTATGVTSLAVIDLYQRTYKILLDDVSRTDNLKFRRFFFCPKDAHGTIVCSTELVQERFELYVVDFPRGMVRQFRSSHTGVNSIFCTREECSYNGDFPSMSSTQLPITTSLGVVYQAHDEWRLHLKPTFHEFLFNLDEHLNPSMAVQRWKADPEELEEQARSGQHQQSCGIIGIVWADRKVTIEEVDMRRRRDSNLLLGPRDAVYFKKQTYRPSFVNLREVATANMQVQAQEKGGLSNTTGMEAEVQVEWYQWEINLPNCTVGRTNRKRLAHPLTGLVVTREDIAFSGICISPDLKVLSVWLGTHLWFFHTPEGQQLDLELMAYSPRPRSKLQGVGVPPECCVDIRFNAAKSYAVGLWSSKGIYQQNTDTAHSKLQVYNFDNESHLCIRESEIQVNCKSRWYCFHPTRDIMAITTASELLLYDMSHLSSPILLRKLPRSEIQSNMKIRLPKTDGGKASPPSTRDSLSSISAEEADQDPLYFSSCGLYLFGRTWDVFARLEDLLQTSCTPQAHKVLDFFAAETALAKAAHSDPWAEISPQHPQVLYEDVLYSAGQQRFKIFRIRTYISLGWSADGSNFFIFPSESKQESRSRSEITWYRRVLCAIPKAFASWSATLLWPSITSHARRRLVVVMFPAGGDLSVASRGDQGQTPKVIFTGVTGEDLVPDETYLDESGTVHLDGWIRSQAAGCAYHLRHDPGAKKVEVPRAASVNGFVQDIYQGN